MKYLEQQQNQEIYRIQKFLDIYGKEYTFYRYNKDNNFGEREQENGIEVYIPITAAYHESSSGHIDIVVSDSTKTKSLQSPFLLCKYVDVADILLIGDFVQFSNRLYKVNSITDIYDIGIYADISIELIPQTEKADGTYD